MTLDVKKSLLKKNADGSYRNNQTGYVAYFLNFNGIDPNSIKIIDAPEFIHIAFDPPQRRGDPSSPVYSPELTSDLFSSERWKSRYEFFVSSVNEATSIKKFLILEKKNVDGFPSAPVSLLLADIGASTDEEHEWNPINYGEEVPPFSIERSSLKRFPLLAFEGKDADLIAENLNSVIKSCQNDR